MTQFDQTKAIREEIAGLLEVQKALINRENFLRNKLTQLDQEMNMLIKIRGYLDIELGRKRDVLKQMI
jgi:hypothetical protein